MKSVMKIFDYRILLCMQVLISSILIYTFFLLNVFPLKYSALIILLFITIYTLLYLGNKKNSLITKFISIFLCIVLIFPIIYMNYSIKTLGEITEVKSEINRISVVVMKDSQYHEIHDLEGKDIIINTKYNAVAMGDTINQLNELISCNYSSEDNFIKMARKLYDGEVNAMIVNEEYLWAMEHKYENFSEETRTIWTYEHKSEKADIKKPVAVKNDSFNVFISGIDTRGDVSTVSRSDVNMLATVNTTTNKILLISIPRDYYVYIPELDAEDKLTHSGLNGINSSVSTLEGLLNIDINYYVRVNFTSLVTMVDALGGIEVNSPYEFGIKGTTYYVSKGINRLNGEGALMFSRERYLLPDGDNDRVKNQQRVIQGMINKLISPAIITNYTEILEAISGSFETNMSMKEITDLLKGQLENMRPWDIQSYSLKGTGSYFRGGAMMPDEELYYCVPDKKSINEATNYINSMLLGEFVKIE